MGKVTRFLREEQGAVTIEFTVFVPLFIFLFLFMTDAAVIYFTYSQMYNVARDLARKMSIGQITTQAQAQQYAAENLLLGQRTYTIDPKLCCNSVTIWVSVSDAAVFGSWFKPILGKAIYAHAEMGAEPVGPLP